MGTRVLAVLCHCTVCQLKEENTELLVSLSLQLIIYHNFLTTNRG